MVEGRGTQGLQWIHYRSGRITGSVDDQQYKQQRSCWTLDSSRYSSHALCYKRPASKTTLPGCMYPASMSCANACVLHVQGRCSASSAGFEQWPGCPDKFLPTSYVHTLRGPAAAGNPKQQQNTFYDAHTYGYTAQAHTPPRHIHKTQKGLHSQVHICQTLP